MSQATAVHTSWIPEWTFGDRLRKVRTELGMDQREFAMKLDLKAPTLSSYEAGRANPRARDLPSLAARLELLTGVPKAWFIGWETVGLDGIEPPTSTVESQQFMPVISLDDYRSRAQPAA